MNSRSIPVISGNVRSIHELPDCSACGACCRDIAIPLTSQEAALLEEAGTILSIRRKPGEPVPRAKDGTTMYQMIGRCGYSAYTENGAAICTIHEDPDRPDICKDFVEGGFNCRVIQYFAGVITKDELVAYDEATRC